MPLLTEQPATFLVSQMRSGKLKATALMEAAYDRIDEKNPVLNAIVSQIPREAAMEAAHQADHLAKAGAATGLLHGLPMAVKDLSPTRGITTTLGSPIFRDNVPAADGLMVSRLREAGAIIIGKTNTPEFGLGSHTYNPVFGSTGNSIDPTKSAGGSSGGAAVAVASGMVPLADGSDYGGSLRNPAAWNNIYGLRPSQGRVPTVPATDPFFGQMGTDGPMARNIPDLALLLDVQSGYDPRAPLSLTSSPLLPQLDEADSSARLRIGWLGDLSGHLPFEPGILETCETRLQQLQEQGHSAHPAQFSLNPEDIWRAFVTLRQFNLSARLLDLYHNPSHRALLKLEAVWEVEGCLAKSAVDLLEASMIRGKLYADILRLFGTFDILALPATQLHPFERDMEWPRMIAGRQMDSYHRWMEVVVPGTMSGCPVLAAPAGWHRGAPVGIQFIGKPRDDLNLLRFGLSIQHGVTTNNQNC